MEQSHGDAGVDYSRKWLVLAAVAMGVFLGTIDGSIVNVALPTLVRELNTTFPVIQWVVLGYLLAVSTLTIAVGRLGDMVGKKPIFTLGFSVFTFGSLLCALAPSVGWLIGFRVVQATGAAMIVSLGIAILTEGFPPSERGRALGWAGTMVSVGIVVGPTLGGVLIDALSWRWIFLVNLPVGIIGTLTAMRWIPHVPAKGGQRFDFAGAAALFAALITMMLALTAGQEAGFGSRQIIALFVASAMGLAAFVSIERRVAEPIIDLRLFRNVQLSVSLITGFAMFVAIAGTIILLPFYLENALGYPPRSVGLLLATAPVALGVTAPISGSLSDRFGTRPITVIGLSILVAAYVALATLDENSSALRFVIVALPLGVGIGVFQSPNNSAIMSSVPPERFGIASGMLSITRITGQITGIAVLGALWASRVDAATGGSVAATEADPVAQVSGLQDTMTTVAGAIAVATALAVWAWRRERRALATPRPIGPTGGKTGPRD